MSNNVIPEYLSLQSVAKPLQKPMFFSLLGTLSVCFGAQYSNQHIYFLQMKIVPCAPSVGDLAAEPRLYTDVAC